MDIRGHMSPLFPKNNEEVLIKKALGHLDRDISILDVGCGFGDKIELLRSMGFREVAGVEKNERTVKRARGAGLQVVSADEFWASEPGRYDLIIMSHILEHFDWAALTAFLDMYLDLLEEGGLLLIVTPLFHRGFYHDLDHEKPYHPSGIAKFYGEDERQVQVCLKHRLRLEDIYFRRSKITLSDYRSLYIQTGNRLPAYVNDLLRVLFRASHYLVGRKTGWIGLYRKTG